MEINEYIAKFCTYTGSICGNEPRINQDYYIYTCHVHNS